MSPIWFVFIFSYFSLNHQTDAGTFSVDYTNHQFLKDGKPFKYLSGSIHYFRVHPDLWDDRLKRVRAMGLNAIQIYAPWNLHEPTQGNFDFSGIVNLTRFLTTAQQNNLYVLFRSGPYIDAEWEQGGLPYWLLKYDNIKMRTSDPNYTNAVQNYYNKLLDVINPFLYKNGGPILMIQVENEYGLIHACDHNYTAWLRDLVWGKVGNDVVIYTTNPPFDGSLNCGVIPGTLTTVDFAPADHATIDGHFSELDKYSTGPHVNSEYYTQWFVYWGGIHSGSRSTDQIVDNLNYMYQKNASVNLYLVHGGDNFDFWNGAYSDGPVITAYWAKGPISENGDITGMYMAIRNLISNLTDWEYPPTPIPSNNPSSNYGQVSLTRVGSNLVSTISQILEPCNSSKDPLTFEQLDHAYGFVLYTTTLKTGGKTFSAPNIRDAGYVFLNNNYQGMLSSYGNVTSISLSTSAQAGDILRILVENQGRLCGWATYPMLDLKGLNKNQNNVTLDGTLLQDWIQCGVNLTKASVDSLTQNFLETTRQKFPEKAVSLPGVYIGQFTANPIQDTFFNSTGWGKGQLFINGYNLGRYWPTKGPQMTLYVPKPFLQTTNTVLLIELTGAQQNYVNFIDHSIFNYS